MAKIVPHGVFKNGFDLVGDPGGQVGAFHGSVWREGGEITAAGERFTFRKRGRREFVLSGGDGGTVARAVRPAWWGGPWNVTIGRAAYRLAKAGTFSRGFVLLRGGQQVGDFAHAKLLNRTGAATLPTDVPPAAQVFLAALVLTLWKRSDQAAAGAA